jgi:hypothetical protein
LFTGTLIVVALSWWLYRRPHPGNFCGARAPQKLRPRNEQPY